MKKTNNQSFNRIIDYLNSKSYISESSKRLLLEYATRIYKENVENVEKEELDDFLFDLKVYAEWLKSSSDTSITKLRINEIINIILELNDSKKKELPLADLSYKLDKLYLKSNLPMRNKSSLSYNLTKIKERKNK